MLLNFALLFLKVLRMFQLFHIAGLKLLFFFLSLYFESHHFFLQLSFPVLLKLFKLSQAVSRILQFLFTLLFGSQLISGPCNTSSCGLHKIIPVSDSNLNIVLRLWYGAWLVRSRYEGFACSVRSLIYLRHVAKILDLLGRSWLPLHNFKRILSSGRGSVYLRTGHSMLVLGLALHYFVSWLSQCICLIRRIPLQW